MIFKDRREAANKLLPLLVKYKGQKDCIILALPRGGIILGYELASKLDLPLDLVVPRKLGAPISEELAIGAISEQGEKILDEELIKNLNVSKEYIRKTVEQEKKEAERRLKLYRRNRPTLDLTGKRAIIVDDGIATGATMLSAIRSAKDKKAKEIIVAVPVTPKDTIEKIKKEADEFVYLDAPEFFGAIGAFYEKFEQVEDKKVINLMRLAEKFS